MSRERERNQQSDDQPTVMQSNFDAEDSAQFNLRFHIFYFTGLSAPLDRRRGQMDAVVSVPPLSSLLWFDRPLEYPIQAFAKDPVPLFVLVKRKAVRQQSAFSNVCYALSERHSISNLLPNV